MTIAQAKLATAGCLALLALLFGRKRGAPVASVDLGVGTVNGVTGGDYLTPAPPAAVLDGPTSTIEPTRDNPASDPTMRALIDRSDAAIAADNAINGTNSTDTGALL